MNRTLVGGLVSAMVLAAPAAFAGTAAPPAHTHKTATHKTTMHEAAAHKTPAHKMAVHEATMDKAHLHKMAAHKMKAKHTMLHKTAWHRRQGTRIGDREVSALNALEAAGYRSIKDVHAEGIDISANAMQAGKMRKILVTPAGKIMPRA